MEIKRRAVTTREQWLQWRRAYLCASELGAVCGVDEYRTALSVYAEKSGMIQNQPDSPLMRRGRNFERAALTYLGEDYPNWRIQQPNVFLFEDDERPTVVLRNLGGNAGGERLAAAIAAFKQDAALQ